jgi:hypothetical protein
MKKTKSERKTGILQILMSGLCFGFLGVFGKKRLLEWNIAGRIPLVSFFHGRLASPRFYSDYAAKGLALAASPTRGLRGSRRVWVCCFFQLLFPSPERLIRFPYRFAPLHIPIDGGRGGLAGFR